MDRTLLDRSLRFLGLIGLNPQKNNFIERVKAVFSQGVLYVFVIQLFLYCVTRKFVYERMFTNAAIVCVCEQSLTKLLVVVFKRNQLADLISVITTQFWSTDRYGSKLKAQLDFAYRICLKVVNLLIISVVVAGCTYWISPVFKSGRNLPLPLYSAAEVEDISMVDYVFWLGFEIVCFSVVGVPAFGSVDILLAVLIFYNIFQLRLVRQGYLELANDDSEQSTMEDLEKLKELAEHHNLILRCLENIGEIFSISFLNLVISTAIVLCLCSVGIIYSMEPLNLPNLMNFCSVLFCSIACIFLYCALGTAVVMQTEVLAEALYNCGWYKKNKIPLRKSLVFVLHQSQRTIKLSGWGVIDLNLENFTTIMKLAFNFFTVVRAALVKDVVPKMD